ncbi:MAG: hypothetical protein KF718_07720 [Polyangiaceae bacterium]|nr:hypothetical protein [Polyangiaceae bacterium]
MSVSYSRALILATVSAGLWSPTAAAQSQGECASSYEKSQELRNQGQLRGARKQLLTCAQASCADFIKRDCAKWLGEVDAQLPTVVFSARARGQDVTDVEVTIGDEVLAETLDGRAIPMDPGSMVFVFESSEFGRKEKKFVVKEGQKSQAVSVDFGGDDGSGGGVGGSTDDIDRGALPWIFTGVGVIGLGAFGFFALSGKSDEDGLACAKTKTCSDDEIDPIKQKYLIADISLGVGLVSLGVATYLFLAPGGKRTPPAADSARFRFDVAPTRGGGFATVGGLF